MVLEWVKRVPKHRLPHKVFGALGYNNGCHEIILAYNWVVFHPLQQTIRINCNWSPLTSGGLNQYERMDWTKTCIPQHPNWVMEEILHQFVYGSIPFLLQVGPLPVINGVITPINGRVTMVTGVITLLARVVTPFTTNLIGFHMFHIISTGAGILPWTPEGFCMFLLYCDGMCWISFSIRNLQQVILGGLLVGENGTPWKIDMEPKHGGLQDDFPFQLGDL